MGRYLSVGLLILSCGWAAGASAETNMKNCVDYIRSHPDIGPYFPIQEDGKVNREFLEKLVAEKKLKYTLEDGQETITANEGFLPVKVQIDRDSGQITRIVSSVSSVPPAFKSPFQSGFPNPAGTISTYKSSTHKFEYRDGTCIPESAEQSFASTSGMGPGLSGSSQDFNIKSCRALKSFFDEHPGTKACADESIGSRLKQIMASIPAPTFGSALGQNLPLSMKMEAGNLWLTAKFKLSKCEGIPGVNSVMADSALWKGKEPSFETKAADAAK
jgi:hypothetical protein